MSVVTLCKALSTEFPYVGDELHEATLAQILVGRLHFAREKPGELFSRQLQFFAVGASFAIAGTRGTLACATQSATG